MKKPAKELTQAEIQELYIYNPITGELVRRDLPNAKPITAQYVSIKHKLYTTSRIIFCYMQGYMPDTLVMRIDKDVTNNRWDNFTIVSTKTNPRNKKVIRTKSAQKRGAEISGEELMRRFRYDALLDELWFITPEGQEILSTKKVLTIRGKQLPRRYIIQRLNYLKFANQMHTGFEPVKLENK